MVHGHDHGQTCLESLSVHSLCQNSKVAVSESVSHSVTKVRYRAASAAKKTKEENYEKAKGNKYKSFD